jgi:hypothetical protein
MLLPTARRFPELGAVAEDRQLPEARQVNQTARQVHARELDDIEGDVAELEPSVGAERPRSDDSQQEAAYLVTYRARRGLDAWAQTGVGALSQLPQRRFQVR